MDDVPGLRELFDMALRDYRTQCLWYCRPTFCDGGLDVVIDGLRSHGGMNAWKIADAIDELRRGAPASGDRVFQHVPWAPPGEWAFYDPVPDNDFGWRPHEADLAIDAALRTASRKRIADFVDLALVCSSIMPLWHAVWAAPGKDASRAPGAVHTWIARFCGFRQEDLDESSYGGKVGYMPVFNVVRAGLDEALEVFPTLPRATVGMLLVDGNGDILMDPTKAREPGVRTVQARQIEPRVSGGEVDHAVISRLLERQELRDAFAPTPGPERSI